MVTRNNRDSSSNREAPTVAKGLTALARILARVAASEFLRQQTNEAKHGTKTLEK